MTFSLSYVEWHTASSTWGSGASARPPTAAEQALIEGILTQISGTSAGANLLGGYSETNQLKVAIGPENVGVVATAGGVTYTYITINPLADLYHVNPKGEWVLSSLVGTVAHELAHIFLGFSLPDGYYDSLRYDDVLNSSGADYDGLALPHQNAVMEQLGQASNVQVSYGSGLGASTFDALLLKTGVSYSFGATIDAVRVGVSAPPLIDTSNSPNDNAASRDLVFALGGNNEVRTGAGEDFVYGGDGADTIDGGDGNDKLFGEAGNDSIVGGQGADDLTGGAAKGRSPTESDGNDTLRGGDGSDLLTDEVGSNELYGDSGADKFVIKASTNTIAGGQGNDLIDVSEVASGDGPSIQVAADGGHDWIEGLKDGAKLRIEAAGYTADDVEFVVDRSEQVLIYHAGSPEPVDEDPQRWEYLVDVYLKVGGATIYVGQGVWHESEDWHDQVTGELRNLLTKVTFDGTLLDEAWLSHRQDQVDENGFQAAMKAGQDEHYVARGEASAGADSLAGGSGADSLHGAAGGDNLSGGDGEDVLDGGAGDDELSGGVGDDVIRGGSGTDVAFFDGVIGDYAFSRNAAGAMLVTHVATGATDELYSVETLRFSGGGDDVPAASLAPLHGTVGRDEISGTAAGQALFGHGGADVLTPLGGGNTVNGGAGVDKVVYAGEPEGYTFTRQSDGSVTVTHLSGGGTDLLVDIELAAFAGDPDYAVRLSALVGDFGTPDDDYLEGTSEADALYAGAGDDFIDGGGGADTIDGGAGLDAAAFYGGRLDYVVAASGGSVEVAGLGDTAVLTSVEVLLFGDGTAEVIGATDLAGTAGADSLAGSSASEIVSPLAGDDTIDGGAGVDLLILNGDAADYAFLREADGSVGASETATGDVKLLRQIEQVWFSGSKVLVDVDDLVGAYGTPGDDGLNGVDGDERLFGLGGDDVLYETSGADTLDGGAGFDTVTYYGTSGDYTVTTNTDGSIDVIGPYGADSLLGVELVKFWGDGTALLPGAASGLIGTGGADLLIGTANRDIISPLAGADTVEGGGGDDFVVLSGGSDDYAFSRQADGTAIVVRLATNEALTLRDVEQLWFQGTREVGDLGNFSPYGTPYDDWLTGASAPDGLYGLGGDDWLEGGGGDDTLVGAAGDDNLSGDDGADRLVGGAGEDTFNGGAGADILVFDHIPSSPSAEIDEVLGFVAGEDLLDLSLMDADTSTAEDQAFTWIGSASFSNVAGQLRFAAGDWSVMVQGDVDGDGQADFAIELWDVTSLQASDFLL